VKISKQLHVSLTESRFVQNIILFIFHQV